MLQAPPQNSISEAALLLGPETRRGRRGDAEERGHAEARRRKGGDAETQRKGGTQRRGDAKGETRRGRKGGTQRRGDAKEETQRRRRKRGVNRGEARQNIWQMHNLELFLHTIPVVLLPRGGSVEYLSNFQLLTR